MNIDADRYLHEWVYKDRAPRNQDKEQALAKITHSIGSCGWNWFWIALLVLAALLTEIYNAKREDDGSD